MGGIPTPLAYLLLSWGMVTARIAPPRPSKSFREKAGASQDGFVFSWVGSLPLSPAASVAILPSALVC
jgi:hypothetical protein